MNYENFYDNAEAFEAVGIDYDLHACLIANPQGFSVHDIEKVLAVFEGENDGPDWRWILGMVDGRCIFLQGGCDYTGWECSSYATHEVAASPEAAAQMALGTLSGHWDEGSEMMRDDLLRQLTEGKALTWHQQKDAEFGLPTKVIDLNEAHG